MSILGKYNSYLIEEEEDSLENVGFTTPAVIREDKEEFTLKKSILLSTLLHPTVVGSIWLITIILALMGIHLNLFEKPKPKPNDIEFVLVDKEDTPINKNTPYRADRNSRAGGHHDPTRKVSMPSAPAAATQKARPASSTAAPQKKAAPQQKAQPKKAQPAKNPMQQITKELFQKPQEKPAPQPQPAPKAAAKPNPPTARPSIKPPNTPKPVAKPTSGFQVPVPKATAPSKGGHYATGPISGSGKLANGGASGGGSSSGRYTPAPVLAPTGSGSGSKLGKSGYGSGTGSSAGGSGLGNPGPGNPNGRPGIDAIREPDFGPYMRELQRRIKMNWNPPKGNESKRVVLLFKIAKDGRLLSCSVFKSSGLPSADNAALNAVKLTAPFKPLPAEFKGQSIDIQFTFDYNVFGASGY